MSKKKKTPTTANELIRQITGQPVYRNYTVETVNEENRTVELTFSSEYPVERYFGFEVLDHGPSAVRMERFESGASALVNHDWDDLVGVIESASIDGKKGRAVVRFGTSERAEEIWQDVKSGIRKHISIGYIVHAMVLESDENDVRTYRVTDWEPFELSFVTVPADPTVGVGRSMDNEKYLNHLRDMGIELPTGAVENNQTDNRSNPTMNEKVLRDASGRLVRAKVDENGTIVEVLEVIEESNTQRDAGISAEVARVRGIFELFDQYGSRGVDPQAFVRDPTKTVDDYQRALLDSAANGNPASTKRGATPTAADSPDIGLSDNEIRQYSFLNVLRYLANPTNEKYRAAAAFELEASEAAEGKLNREAQGIIVPNDVLRTAAPISTGGTGGQLVATEHASGSFIDMLYNKSAVMNYATTLTGLVGDLSIPTQEGGATGYWLGEDTDATLSEITFGERGLKNRTCAALVEMTRKMLQQSSPDVEMLARNDIAKALALTIDRAALYGTGGDQPLGLAGITGVNGMDFAAINPTYQELVGMETLITADNADVGSMMYLMNATGRGHCKTSQKFANTNGAPIWEAGNTVNGYGTHISNQITNGDYWFGVWSEMMIGLWGGLDLTIDPYTHSAKGRLRVVAFQDADVTVRHPESFCLGKKPTA
ncbi:phage major capsid protein [Enterovibrio norvegicus]|uniref:phage major capsid protein n=1 Tax=Enterovibrio norvegicus TaxID=188144 RepID=UPI00354E1B83